MKSVNCYYTNKEALESFIVEQQIQNSSSLLIQVFSAINDELFISGLLSEITLFLPDAVIIGSTTDGEILDGKVSSGKVVLSFTQFEHTTLKAAGIENENNGYYSGQYLAKELIGHEAKLLIAFADSLHTNGDEFLNGIASINDDIIVSGGHAGDAFEFKKTYVFTKENIIERGAVAVVLSSKDLHVHVDHSFNWHPIGNELTVTKAEGNRVYTIDGKSAVDIYAYYLGEDIAKGLPGIGIEFPLMVNRNGLTSARATIAKMDDGSLIAAGNLYTGEKVRIGFGSKKGIIEASHKVVDCVSQEPSEAIFVYSCTARKQFMGDEIESEILPLQHIAPVSGFFTHGEFFTSDKKELLNQTMTLVSLSESDDVIKSTIKIESQKTDLNSASMAALAHLVNLTTREVQERTEKLKASNKLNQQLKERMEMALAGSKTSVLDWDFTNNSFCISSSWKEMLGYRDDELPNSTSTWFQLAHPDDKKSVLALLRHHQRKQIKYFEINHRLKHKDGHWIWVLGRAQILYDKNGKKVRMIGTHTDITEEKELQLKYSQQSLVLAEQKDMLYHQANYDTLTGLPNRALFADRLKQGIKKAVRHNEGLALFFIDLDKFKHINDSLGHETGDNVLKITAKRLRDVIRTEDTLARLSGDEFTVIMEELKRSEDVSVLADKILKVLGKSMYVDDNLLYVSGSIGISLYPQDTTDAKLLLKYADTAMYQAKEEGRNNFQFYSHKMTELALERLALRTALRQAIDNKEFIVYYQPQIDASANTLVGLEALVRWQHPARGLLEPARFILLAEETGLIVELDRWVMRTAMMQVSEWYKAGLIPDVLALNLSVKQLEDDHFLQEVKDNLKKYDFKPEWLEFEIMESQMMKNPEKTIGKLKQINDLGIGVSVDDFGTGYSSMSLLKRLPINRLKIDQSFIRDAPEDEESVAIIKAIIALGVSLKLDLVAEGVETLAQRDFLIQNGCTKMQGYYYDKPMPSEEVEAKLLNHTW